MQVKVFESSDMASGLKMVKDELGPDALILSTKTIRSGKLGLLGKNRFEITAAVDSVWPDKKNNNLNSQSSSQQHPTERDILLDTDIDQPLDASPTYNSAFQLNGLAANKPETIAIKQEYSVATKENQSNLQSEVDELKGMIKNLGREMLRINNSHPTVETTLESKHPETDDGYLQSLQQRLLDYGITPETAKTISGFAKESLTLDQLTDPFKLQKYIEEIIQGFIHVNPDIFKENKRQHRVALVGPTGVGKTTTLAKIAAGYLSKHSASIGFITIDTYRIAAVEQLKVYGDIMNIPVEVVLSPEQLEPALLKLRDKELVLIDTAGRSPQDSLCIEELASFLNPELGIEKHLVLSATTRDKELFEAIQRFSILDIDNTIITKIDECTSFGLLLDIQIREEISYSYITNGQRVPEDIMEADKKILTQLIMSPGKGLPYE
ncbi:MAG: flagellar biosynthesis protein FlhF [Thermodesulfobacteriota bacterium]|nr:flagellar biosynthesis protein FlhF [Thermodesulfobacteriota bacterium]